ncbi:metallophosphoesterase [Mucilaginibacter ximonensis]|uniref:Metallophosphoesterase n=1 Tax=Mucilaginibacter ximonensis TaxID=538021 RepID=A0ABW5YAB0_9SPHI
MRRLLFLLTLLPGLSWAQKSVQVDGPYVRYEGQQRIVKTIWQDDDDLVVKTEHGALNVVPEGHPEWAFQVKLHTIGSENAAQPLAEKTLFMSDIEGEFAKFRKLLLAAQVIDSAYNWTYGHGSLVIAGDLFDRGKDVVPELWLLYKLEDDAAAAGGSVHVLLGNHDVMNLSGDYRYTDAKYFKHAWFLNTGCAGLFGADTELGRWLRSKNIIEKIGNVLVMHGGLSPALKGLTLDEVNKKYQPYGQQVKVDRNAPFWYRGYFRAPKISMAGVDSTLAAYSCKYIVVGHTIIKWNIASFYEGKIIGVDVDEHKGKPMAALLENGQWFTIDDTGERKRLQYKPSNDQINEKDIL